MASTSLAQQLKRLEAPQTYALLDTREKASLIYNNKEAATKDRRTIFELGLSGLRELSAINSKFQQFEYTLFDETSIEFERSVEQSEVNKLLDANINKFLQHLSPYFLLRPAHLCIEWLLRRFYVHHYNADALLALALPYHETNIFVRVVQTLPMRNLETWLHVVKKSGLTLPKASLHNRAATERSFLNFICKSALETVSIFEENAYLLQALLNFYTTTVVGALAHAQQPQEWHITAILPSLLKFLSSDIADVLSAAYMVTMQLVSRMKLTAKLGNALLARVSHVRVDTLSSSAVLLLNLIFVSQPQLNTTLRFTDDVLLELIKERWLCQLIAEFFTTNINVLPLCVQLLKQSVTAIQNEHSQSINLKLFLQRFLFQVKFNDTDAQEFISTFLNCLDVNFDIVDAEFQEWYKDYLKQLEHQYPNAFDWAVKIALSTSDENPEEDVINANKRSDLLRLALGFRLKSVNEDDTNVYEKLYHPIAKIRLFAVQTFLENLTDLLENSQNQETVQQCINDRIQDDSEEVVAEMLKLSTEKFVEILGPTKFVQVLHRILLNAQVNESGNWTKLMPRVVQHLVASQTIDNHDINILILVLMPVFLPKGNDKMAFECLEIILTSPLSKKIQFIQNFKNHKLVFDDTNSLKRQFVDILADSQSTQPDQLYESIQNLLQQQPEYFKTPLNFTHYLLLMTASFKDNLQPMDALKIFRHMSELAEKFQLKHVDHKYWQRTEQLAHVVPLQLYCDFILNLVRNTQFTPLNDKAWTEKSTSFDCFVQIFAHIAGKLIEMQKLKIEQQECSNILSKLYDIVLPDLQQKFEFLLNFGIYTQMPHIGNYALLRVIAFKLLNSVIVSKNNANLDIKLPHVLKINATLQSTSAVMRQLGLKILSKINDHINLDGNLKLFIKTVVEREEEITMDEEQFPLITYLILKSNDAHKLNMQTLLNDIIKICTTACLDYEADFICTILQTLKHIDDATLLLQLIPLAQRILKHKIEQDGVKLLKTPYSTIFELIYVRLNARSLKNLLLKHEKDAWFFAEALETYDTYFVNETNKLSPLPCAVLMQFNADLYNNLNEQHKFRFIKLIIKTIAAANNDIIFLAAHKLFKKCELDCSPLVNILKQMHNSQIKNKLELSTQCQAWKEGVVLLELLDNRKHLLHVEAIIPSLFDLLRICLQAEAGEGALEYVKQLTLSVLLNCCQKAKAGALNLPKLLPETSFRVDQVVQCVRITKNPQTLHKALQLLTHCADLYPQQVLNNIMEIFTFMGSSIVRTDDAFSFKIICQIIETVIPILLQSTANSKNITVQQETVIPMLKMFVYIIFDVPEHRRMPLYCKLLSTLGVADYLWLFLCILFEKLCTTSEEKKRQGSEKVEELNKYMEVSLNLINCFEANCILETCIQLMRYMRTLPQSVEELNATECGNLQQVDNAEKSLFDIKTHTPKQLRHYKYVIMQFLSTISSSTDFLQKLSKLNETDLGILKPYYQNFIIQTLTFVPKVNVAIECSEDALNTKFWKVILHHLHDILDNVISLLSPDMFVVVVNGLLQHQLPSIRRKVSELLFNKLQHSDNFVSGCESTNLKILLQTLSGTVKTILDSVATTSPQELAYIQQAQLLALKLLSRRIALTYLSEFKDLLINLIKLLKERKNLAKVLPGTVYLTTVEIASNLKAHCLPQLPKFMPLIVEVLQEQVDHLHNNPPEHMTVATISGLQKLFESLPLFLGPYLVNIMMLLSTLHIRVNIRIEENSQPSQTMTPKLKQIWSRMANTVPARILVPSCEKAYKKLLENKSYAEVPVLMQMLTESISLTQTADLATLQTELSNLFLQTISYRLSLIESKLSRENMTAYESPILDAMVAWVLKLSESYFRLYYQRIHKWAFKDIVQPEAQLTYFLLTLKISQALKSLFVLFANDFIDDAAKILKKHENDDTNSELLQAIIKVLYNVFLHDSKTFINTHRFEILMQPLVDQLEENLLLQAKEQQELLTNCLCQLAVISPSDVHRKELVYQVLLKTRSDSSDTQIWAFNCCVEIARCLGEEFRSLLPEVVPFIAELFEDDDPEVEKSVRKSVQQLEIVLGESLQKYL